VTANASGRRRRRPKSRTENDGNPDISIFSDEFLSAEEAGEGPLPVLPPLDRPTGTSMTWRRQAVLGDDCGRRKSQKWLGVKLLRKLGTAWRAPNRRFGIPYP
jgi:hypothetical protein